MKEITIKAYEVSELSDKAKDRAFRKWLNNFEYFWYDENKASLNAFEDIFPIEVNNFEYGNGGYINWTFTEDERIRELSGQRLATYLWNNYRWEIFKGKYYSLWSKKEVSYEYHKNGCPVLKSRRSKIIMDNCCVLTGYTTDDSLLIPVYDFMNKPDSRDFEDLLNDCLNEWVKDCNADYEYAMSTEAFEEYCESNDLMFDENGRQL
jgi:hypothetical protein